MNDNDKRAIEEMAKVMCGYYGTEKCYDCRYCCDCHIKQEATRLYNAGYRKQSGAHRQIPCEIGSKIYEVTGEPGEQIDIDEYTVSEVGLNGVFTHGGILGLRHRHYFAYADEGAWWFFKREDAEAEKKRRNEP